MRLNAWIRLAAIGLLAAGLSQPLQAKQYTAFESGLVRPLALSPDGNKLFAVNSPDNRLEIFDVGALGITHSASVPVGVDPVAVAARTNTEVWVVNHLSDSVSIVDVGATPPRVIRTLLVGDEPRDIVFGGSAGNRAFITTAHRGQNRPGFDPQLTTPSVGRADVFVFDALNLGASLEGTPLTVVSLFADTPRALAVSADGSTVYAAAFHSGNQTTAISEGTVCPTNATNITNNTMQNQCTLNGTTYPGGMPLPHRSSDNVVRPETGLIVRFNGTNWVDRACVGGANRGQFCTVNGDCPSSTCGRNWSPAVRFNLPDKDVFAIDANANPPAETAFFTGVGTILFNMAVNPMSGKVYVSNTEARNEVRFEGSGSGGSTVRGHLQEARITVLDGMAVTPRHLNKHIDYSVYPAPAGVNEDSLATPTQMAVSNDGSTLYVAAFGSGKVGIFDTAALEGNTFTPDDGNHIAVGGGPAAVVLDASNAKLYVLTRFDNAVSVIDTGSKAEIDRVSLFNPEPPIVVNGRRFLYDAAFTSSNGEASCASCHIFGDFDSLSWDLGNPDDEVLFNPNPIRVDNPLPGFFPSMQNFHPMKGPMSTQSLRGMANHGPMHWRGDRTGGNDPGGSALDEDAAFKKFNGAFAGLVGRSGPLADDEMQAFADFILQVNYPPNPIRNLDNSFTADQAVGRSFFHSPIPSDLFESCNGCHRHDVDAGFFGTDGFSSFEGEPQFMKIAHLRNMYQKVGMFGMPAVAFFNAGDNAHKGDQIRGVGFLHDGSTDTIFRFLQATVFNQVQFLGPFEVMNPGGFPNGAAGNPLRRQVEAFIMAMDSTMKPVVGQQTTLTDDNAGDVGGRVALLIARATAGDCDLIVKGAIGGQQRGWYFDGTLFRGDRIADAPLADGALRALAATPGQELTYTCVPPGSGIRAGVDRDGDGVYDGDEADAGSNASDPIPVCSGGVALARSNLTITKNDNPRGDESLRLKGQAVISGSIDPVANGFSFRVDDKEGATLLIRHVPSGLAPDRVTPGWSVNSQGTKWTYKDRNGSNGGITKVVISDRSSREPGLFIVSVSGKKSDYRVAAAAVPLRVTMLIGAGDGQCADVAYGVPSFISGSNPVCEVTSNLKRVKCK